MVAIGTFFARLLHTCNIISSEIILPNALYLQYEQMYVYAIIFIFSLFINHTENVQIEPWDYAHSNLKHVWSRSWSRSHLAKVSSSVILRFIASVKFFTASDTKFTIRRVHEANTWKPSKWLVLHQLHIYICVYFVYVPRDLRHMWVYECKIHRAGVDHMLCIFCVQCDVGINYLCHDVNQQQAHSVQCWMRKLYINNCW